MRFTRIFALICLALIPLSGADCKPEVPKDYNTSVTVTKTNGKVTAINVHFQFQQGEVTIYNRKDAMAFTAQLESIASDLKALSDQFPVEETKPVGVGK